jgi:hypothetical protein
LAFPSSDRVHDVLNPRPELVGYLSPQRTLRIGVELVVSALGCELADLAGEGSGHAPNVPRPTMAGVRMGQALEAQKRSPLVRVER